VGVQLPIDYVYYYASTISINSTACTLVCAFFLSDDWTDWICTQQKFHPQRY